MKPFSSSWLLTTAFALVACGGDQYSFITNPTIKDFTSICMESAPGFENLTIAAESRGYSLLPEVVLNEFNAGLNEDASPAFEESSIDFGARTGLRLLNAETGAGIIVLQTQISGSCAVFPAKPSREASSQFQILIEQFSQTHASEVQNIEGLKLIKVDDKYYSFLDNRGAGNVFLLIVLDDPKMVN